MGYLCYPKVPQGSLLRIYYMNEGGRGSVALGSQASGVTTEVAPAIQLGSQHDLLRTTSAGVPKLQPVEDPQRRGCSTLSVTDPKSHLRAQWGAATPAPTAARDGQVRSAPADTPEDQQLLHRKTNSMRKPWFCPMDLHLHTLPLDTSWFLLISHKLYGRTHSYSVYNPDQSTLTSSHLRNKKTQALLTFYCGGSCLQETSVVSFVHKGRQIKILTQNVLVT